MSKWRKVELNELEIIKINTFFQSTDEVIDQKHQ